MIHRLLRPTVASALIVLGLAIASAPVSAQTDPNPELLPMVGNYTLWCTWANPPPGSVCQTTNHHESPAVDISADFGEPIYAAGVGTVVTVEGGCRPDQNDGCNNGAGNYVVIDHGHRRSRYLHLSRIIAKPGPIEAGDLVGTSGNSGSTAFPHLHYDETTDEKFGDRIKPGKMLACHGNKVVTYPHVLGVTSWGDAPYGSKIRNDGYECLIPGWTPPPLPDPPKGGGSGPSTSRFVPLTPKRLLDTREAGAAFGRLAGGETATVEIDASTGIPARASAVVMNVTAVDANSVGHLTVWPHHDERPHASSLNVKPSRPTVANLVTVPIGAHGGVDFYATAAMDLVVDIAGYYVPVEGAPSQGRFVALTPTRLLDTRIETPRSGGDRVAELEVAGIPIVPADALAVVVNLTATDTAGDGYVTAWPTGKKRPLASNLNPTRSNDTVPNMAIVPVGKGGRISLFSSRDAELIVDITGFFTGPGAEGSRHGLFVPVGPFRSFDTRTKAKPNRALAPKTTLTHEMFDPAHMPDDVGALALNITATDAVARGFVTVWPTGESRPTASSINLSGPDDTRPNAAYLPLGDAAALDYYSQSGADLLADVFGYFTE